MSEKKYEVFRSEIVESDAYAGIVRTIDKVEHAVSTIQIIEDVGNVATRKVTTIVPYSGTEQPFELILHTPDKFRAELPA